VHLPLVDVVLSLWADRRSDNVAAIGCGDRFKLLGRAVAYGLDTSARIPLGLPFPSFRARSKVYKYRLMGTDSLSDAYAGAISRIVPRTDAIAHADANDI
jgi:hypothetical protein